MTKALKIIRDETEVHVTAPDENGLVTFHSSGTQKKTPDPRHWTQVGHQVTGQVGKGAVKVIGEDNAQIATVEDGRISWSADVPRPVEIKDGDDAQTDAIQHVYRTYINLPKIELREFGHKQSGSNDLWLPLSKPDFERLNSGLEEGEFEITAGIDDSAARNKIQLATRTEAKTKYALVISEAPDHKIVEVEKVKDESPLSVAVRLKSSEHLDSYYIESITYLIATGAVEATLPVWPSTAPVHRDRPDAHTAALALEAGQLARHCGCRAARAARRVEGASRPGANAYRKAAVRSIVASARPTSRMNIPWSASSPPSRTRTHTSLSGGSSPPLSKRRRLSKQCSPFTRDGAPPYSPEEKQSPCTI